MPVVPIRTDQQAPQPTIQPPPNVYLMMAAAQMHKEGRLVQAPSATQSRPSLAEISREGIQGGLGTEEWESAGTSKIQEGDEKLAGPKDIPPDAEGFQLHLQSWRRRARTQGFDI